MKEGQKKALHEQYACASDDTLQNVLKNSSRYTPDAIAVVAEIWISRPEGQVLYARYAAESDEVLLTMLKNSSSYAPDVVAVVSTIWTSRGHRLPDNELKKNTNRTKKFRIIGVVVGFLVSCPVSYYITMPEIVRRKMSFGDYISGYPELVFKSIAGIPEAIIEGARDGMDTTSIDMIIGVIIALAVCCTIGYFIGLTLDRQAKSNG